VPGLACSQDASIKKLQSSLWMFSTFLRVQ
jgi:hypothetical protein